MPVAVLQPLQIAPRIGALGCIRKSAHRGQNRPCLAASGIQRVQVRAGHRENCLLATMSRRVTVLPQTQHFVGPPERRCTPGHFFSTHPYEGPEDRPVVGGVALVAAATELSVEGNQIAGGMSKRAVEALRVPGALGSATSNVITFWTGATTTSSDKRALAVQDIAFATAARIPGVREVAAFPYGVGRFIGDITDQKKTVFSFNLSACDW